MAKKRAVVKGSKPKSAKPKKKAKPAKAKAPAKPKPKKTTKKATSSRKKSPVARRPPQVESRPRDALVKQLLDAVDEMQDLAPGTVSTVTDAPQNQFSRTPWRLMVRFHMPRGSSYDDVFQILRDWRDDSRVEKKIGQDRLSRIQVVYHDKKGRGAKGEYTLSEIGNWEIVISRAVERVGVRDDRLDSLIARYGTDSDSVSYVDSLVVWLSSMTGKELKIAKQEAKAAKGRRGI